MVGPQIDGNSRVTIRTSTSNGPWPLISEWQERVTRSGWILAGRTKLSLSFSNARKQASAVWQVPEQTEFSLSFPNGRERSRVLESYLVDPASSHMLVSKIKPCMS